MGGLESATAAPQPDPADEALTSLYAAHWRLLVRVAWLLLHDQQGAEDVVQDAFVAMRRRSRLTPIGPWPVFDARPRSGDEARTLLR